MAPADVRTHEISFCGRVKSWADQLFRERADFPFKRVEIEETLSKTRKRSDLRIYDRANKLVLAGEVKLPGTPEGQDPYHHALVEDAYRKADYAQAQFFFTWNVNKLILFDRSLWDKSLYEKRIQEYDLGLNLQTADDVSRPAVEASVQEFVGKFFSEFADILSGAKPDWGMAPDEYFIRAFNSHISWPVKLTSEARRSSRVTRFCSRQQGTVRKALSRIRREDDFLFRQEQSCDCAEPVDVQSSRALVRSHQSQEGTAYLVESTSVPAHRCVQLGEVRCELSIVRCLCR